MFDYNFAADLEDQISYPAYNPNVWATRADWFRDLYENGYYWIEDDYNEDGTPKKAKNGS